MEGAYGTVLPSLLLSTQNMDEDTRMDEVIPKISQFLVCLSLKVVRLRCVFRSSMFAFVFLSLLIWSSIQLLCPLSNQGKTIELCGVSDSPSQHLREARSHLRRSRRGEPQKCLLSVSVRIAPSQGDPQPDSTSGIHIALFASLNHLHCVLF
jgi:hypothetical protein